jgi:hypothetical protein
MAFSFYGTFTTAQFEQLRIFAKVQERDLKERRKWLQAAMERNGLFATEYDLATSLPVRFEATAGSYAAKLLIAYKALGGTPEKDMLLRTSDQPVYLTRGTNISSNAGTDPTSGYSDTFTNGRRYRGTQRFDRDLGIQVDRLKSWQLEAIKRKRERLEFKIKRALDLSDQLQREADAIDALLDITGGTTVDDQIRKVQAYMFRTGAQNVVDDPTDIFGFGIGRIFDPTYAPDYDNAGGQALRGGSTGKVPGV